MTRDEAIAALDRDVTDAFRRAVSADGFVASARTHQEASVFYLLYFCNMTKAEAGRVLGISQNSIYSRIKSYLERMPVKVDLRKTKKRKTIAKSRERLDKIEKARRHIEENVFPWWPGYGWEDAKSRKERGFSGSLFIHAVSWHLIYFGGLGLADAAEAMGGMDHTTVLYRAAAFQKLVPVEKILHFEQVARTQNRILGKPAIHKRGKVRKKSLVAAAKVAPPINPNLKWEIENGMLVKKRLPPAKVSWEFENGKLVKRIVR